MRCETITDCIRLTGRNVLAFISFAVLALLLCSPNAFAVQEETEGAEDRVVQDEAKVEKSETVYGMLNADGTVRNTYVVNRFTSNKPCSVEDYGAYVVVSNLSTVQPLSLKDGKVVIEVGKDPFFYQGTLGAAQLPWIISLAYFLDGEEISAKDLAGCTGKLEIELNIRENPQVKSVFHDSFVLQSTFTLPGGRCSAIKAKGATLALSGENQTIAFTTLPGHEGNYKITAQVKDFEMPSAQIAALPYSSVIEMPDTSEMEDGLESLSDALSQLNQGTNELADGASELSSGADSLASGAQQFGDGLATLSSSSDQIVKASSQINDVLAQIANALEDVDFSNVDSLSQYSPLMRDIAQALEALKDIARGIDDGYARIATIMDYLASVVKDYPLSDDEIAALRDAVADDEDRAASLDKLLSAYSAMQTAVSEYYEGGGTPESIAEKLDEIFSDGGDLDQVVDTLRTAADYIANGGVEQLKSFASGLADLSAGYSEFHAGLVAYAQGVKQLNDNYDDLSSGMSALADGTSQFSAGADQLSDGVSQLSSATSDLPSQMRERMDEMMADYDFPEFDPVSFVDERNKNVSAVQFIFMSDAIEKPDPSPDEDEPKTEPSLWERFLALFGW